MEMKIMLIHTVCKECSLTKKAIKYYMNQKLICFTIQNNGYRNFSDNEIYHRKTLQMAVLQEKQKLIQELTEKQD